MAMTNTDLQAFFDAHKDNIFAIGIDNGRTFFLGYESSPKMEDVSLETIGGVDYIVLHRADMNNSDKVKYKLYQMTEYVQWIGVVDDESSKYNPDPMLFR